MSQNCNVCQGSGFVNVDQIDGLVEGWTEMEPKDLLAALEALPERVAHDVAPCSCCGTGDPNEEYPWYGTPGEHYGDDDPPGDHGPYQYNGGLCECH